MDEDGRMLVFGHEKAPLWVLLSWLGMRDSPCRQKKITFAVTTFQARGGECLLDIPVRIPAT